MNEQNKANERLQRGVYTDVHNPRKAQFNAIMRRSKEAIYYIYIILLIL